MSWIVYYDIVKHEMNWFYLTLSVMFIFRADPKFLRLTQVTLKYHQLLTFLNQTGIIRIKSKVCQSLYWSISTLIIVPPSSANISYLQSINIKVFWISSMSDDWHRCDTDWRSKIDRGSTGLSDNFNKSSDWRPTFYGLRYASDFSVDKLKKCLRHVIADE